MNEDDFIEMEKLLNEGKLVKIQVKDLIPELTKIFSNEFLKKKGAKVGTKAFHDKYSMIIETKSQLGFLIRVNAEILLNNLPKENLSGKETINGKKISLKQQSIKKPENNKNFKIKDERNRKTSLTHDEKEYSNSTGWKIHQHLKMIEFYKYFFDRNYLDLLKKIYEYKENLSYLFAIKSDGSRNLDDFKKELARFLHNYLMSLFSLKDKTMALRNNINNNFNKKISEEEYTNKLIEFKVDEYSSFLKNLRHEFTHGTKKEGLDKLVFSYDLINSLGDIYVGDESIVKVIKNYNSSVNQFYNWLFNLLKDKFSEEFDETSRLIREYNKNLGFIIDPGKGVKHMKEYICYQCKKKFKSSKPLGFLDKDDKLLGYICDACKEIFVKEKTKSIKCSNCHHPLKDIKVDGIPSIQNNDVGVYLFYKCPLCNYEGYIFLKLGKKEFHFVKK